MGQINYEKLPGTPAPYIPPYQTLNYEIEDIAGAFTAILKIDSSGGTIGASFSTAAPGLYQGLVLIPSGTPVIGLMISCPVRDGSSTPLIANIRDLGAGGFAFTVQDPVTALYLGNWRYLQLTIYVKTT
jgi:hypothetical protein